MRALLCFLLLLTIPGCSMLQPSPELSASQLREMAKDKNGSVICATVLGPWGSGRTVVVSLDQNVIRDGGVQVDGNCLVSISLQQQPQATAAKKEATK